MSLLVGHKAGKMNLRPVRNPELEVMRNEVLETKQEDDKIAKELASQLSTIHAAYLFCGCGKSALSQICTIISGTPGCSNITAASSWKDLGSLLGLSFHQICCIENYKYSDFTENVLKAYAQKMDSTLDKVVIALCELKRYDAIAMALPYLQTLEKQARREQVARTEIEDYEYHSITGLETEKPTYDGILRPTGIRHLKSQLHITLRNLEIPLDDDDDKSKTQDKIDESIQQSTVINRANQNQKRCSIRVMLTFAPDGENVAYRVAAQFRKERDGFLPIGVLILDENYDIVEANPDQFITHYFPKLDYIIPIITPNYLDCINKNATFDEGVGSAIDTRYVQMIYSLMMKYYRENSCQNNKVRPIIPNNYQYLAKDARMKGNLVLEPYILESHLEKLASRILKKKYKNK